MSAPADGSIRVIIIAMLANLGIALSKFVGWFLTGSASLLAEAIHSVVDSTNQVLLLVGSRKAKQPPNDLHPLGYGREEFFWSFIVAILLFSVGGLFAIYEGAHRLSAHGEVTSPLVGLGILIIGIILESYSFVACYREVKMLNTYPNLWRWLRRTTSPQLLVIFVEDAAALTGLMVATLALILAWVTGDPTWDGLGSIAVGAILLVVAVFLAIEIKSLIIGESPSTDFRPFVRERIAAHIPGGKLFKLIALQTGANEVLISYKISPGQITDVSQLIDAINRIEVEMKERFPEIRWQFVEPDVRD